MNEVDHPVILLEGMRKLSDAERPYVVQCGRLLAETFPEAIFRSGNAPGTDAAFAEGVASVDAGRLQVIAPYEGHRKKHVPEGAHVFSVREASYIDSKRLDLVTRETSPQYGSLLDRRDLAPAVGARAEYILRDTFKVVGGDGLAPANMGVFYVDADAPETGGTGHTARVCLDHDVPVVTQADWMQWL